MLFSMQGYFANAYDYSCCGVDGQVGEIYAVQRWMTAVLRGGSVQRDTATAVDDFPEESRETTLMPTQPQPANSSVGTRPRQVP